MANSTFCLVLRGDNENSRKFTEVILAGCIPVLIADMPAWPFDWRLDYRTFSYEFDWRLAIADPAAVVTYLMGRPVSEVAAKRRRLLAVRHHFFYRADGGASPSLEPTVCSTKRWPISL